MTESNRPDSIRAIWWPDRKVGKPWVAEFRKGRGYFPIQECETPAAAVRLGRAIAHQRGLTFISENGANDQDP